MDALVEYGLDLSPIYDDYTEVRGGPPYDPRLMVKILIYGYSHGITSSRALERRCHDDIAYGFLTAQQAPDFVAISRFRTRHAEAFKKLFTQSLALCAQAGLVCLGRVALDGSKIRASASRHRAMSYDRMVRAEGELAAARGASRRSGRRRLPWRRSTARKARAQAEQAATERGEDPAQATQAGDIAEAAAVVPAKAQRSFTDPDSRIMKTSDGSFHYCYNAQHIVDERSQVILSWALRPSGADCPALPDMLTALKTSLAAAGIEGLPKTFLACDGGTGGLGSTAPGVCARTHPKRPAVAAPSPRLGPSWAPHHAP